MNKISLALIGKLIRLYEMEDRSKEVFISLETTPMPYTDKDFIFVDEAGSDAQKLREAKQKQYQFFEQSDMIPKVSRIWQEKFGEFSKLSNVYEHVLKRMIPLEETLTSEQLQEHEEAKLVLNSEKKQIYDDYKNRFQEQQDELLEVKLEIISSDDPNKIGLLNQKKEILEERLNEFEYDWIAQGHKNEIKNALATFTRLDAIKNSSVQREWNEAKDDFLKFTEDTIFSGITYKPTYYRPVNFNDKNGGQSGWKRVTITKDEIDELATLAEQSFFTGDQDVSDDNMDYDIKKISVEIIDLNIDRPWFKPDLLMQRNWRFPDGETMLSTDNKGQEELLPAYIMSLLMARNVDVELAQTQKNQKKIQHMMKVAAPLQIGPMLLEIPKAKSAKSIKKVSLPRKLNPAKANLFRKNMQQMNKLNTGKKKANQKKMAEINKNVMLFEPKINTKTLNAKTTKQPFVKSNLITSKAILKPMFVSAISKKVFGFKGHVEGDGLSGKQVTLRFLNLHKKGNSKVIKTDKDGNYVAKLAPGDYRIIIKRDGYLPFEKTYKMRKGQKNMRNVDIHLQLEESAEINESDLEKQYEGYLLLGYKCRKLPKLPNPKPELMVE